MVIIDRIGASNSYCIPSDTINKMLGRIGQGNRAQGTRKGYSYNDYVIFVGTIPCGRPAHSH